MLIVFEGCDGSGKTTFVERTAEVLGFAFFRVNVVSRKAPVRRALEEYELDLEESYDRTAVRSATLCDRWHMGELIYGPLFRGKSELTLGSAWHVDAFLQSRGAVQIIMDQPPNVIANRLRRRGENLLNVGDVDGVCDYYRFLAHVFSRSTRVFVGTPTEIDITTMLRDAHTAAQRALPLAKFPTYVGPLEPDIVLLGERRNRPTALPDHQAAFVPYSGTSGRWLCDAITSSDRLFHRKIGLANACEEDVTELVRTLGTPRVVALGNDASRACVDSLCEHGQVPHPQYGRRFKHHKRDEYTAAILEAAETHKKVDPKW